MAESNDLELPSLQKLQSAEQMELLEVVDSLRACGLSEIVALPQLIVCGDQSSGKSSVLEGISGIPFPKQDTLCTRFATEVILRRTPKVEINVSIAPGDDRALIDRDRLLRFRRELKTKDDFGDLFKSARDEMGLSSSGKSFSKDILRIEFCGPSQPQLTLVDLPGLIHSETSSQSAGDVQLVHNLVNRYLENPRSIILAVVSAKNDIGNQIILRNARNVDPQGLRTLGIITKPDLLAKGSKSEEAFINLARNEDVKFALGWHVVKNLDSALSQNQEEGTRDQQETLFFQESGFNRLLAHNIGITSLRTRLSKVLFSQIRRELPGLVEDIKIEIGEAIIARDRLGPSRTELEQQREFLISLSQTFQGICRDAVKGNYDHEFFERDKNPERRLCASVMNMHFDFARNIRKNGASWLVDDDDASDEKYRTREEAIEEACTLLKRSRGRELPGLPNPLLVGELFRQYSRPWGDLARLHIKEVWEASNRFLELLLRHLTDEDVCENVLQFWLRPIMEDKLNLAYSRLDELLEVHKDHPMTTNSQFLNHSRTPRPDSNAKNLGSMIKGRLELGRDVSEDDIARMMSTLNKKVDLDMDMIAAEEAFDNMNAYYEVAMNLFTDNVPTLTIQGPIIREVPKIFCPTAVYSMDTAVVGRIAGETDEKMMERESILRRLATLEKGAFICKQYAKRPQQVLSISSDEIESPEPFIVGSRTPRNDVNKHRAKSPFTRIRSQQSTPKAGDSPNIFAHLLVPSQMETGSAERSSLASVLPGGIPSRTIKVSLPKSPGINPDSSKSKHSGVASGQSKVGLFGLTAGSSSGTTSSTSPFTDEAAQKPAGVGLFNLPPPSAGGLFSTLGTATAIEKPQRGGLFDSKPIATVEKQAHTGGVDSSSTLFAPSPAFGAPTSTISSGGLFGRPQLGFSPLPADSTPVSGSTPAATNNNQSGSQFGSKNTANPSPPLQAKFTTDPNTTIATTAMIAPTSTIWVRFKPSVGEDAAPVPNQLPTFQHISFMPEFATFSNEELRLNDYKLGVVRVREKGK